MPGALEVPVSLSFIQSKVYKFHPIEELDININAILYLLQLKDTKKKPFQLKEKTFSMNHRILLVSVMIDVVLGLKIPFILFLSNKFLNY